MKLNEIKKVYEGEVDLKEGVIPFHVTHPLNQVVRDGGITNNVQTFLIAGLVNMFKNTGTTRWPRENIPYEMATSSELIEAVKVLAPEDVVQLSSWLLANLEVIGGYEGRPAYCMPQCSVGDWVKLVVKAQE